MQIARKFLPIISSLWPPNELTLSFPVFNVINTLVVASSEPTANALKVKRV